MDKNGNIVGLGLESSCDETAASVVINGREIISNEIYTQIPLHQEYFGVVPEIASRAHLEKINLLIEVALNEAGVTFDDLDYVAATNRPGLVGSLLIAMQSGKAISYVKGIPLIGVNHLEAHLYAPFLEGATLEFPYLGLLVSGGNTVLYRIDGVGQMEIIGKTVDDAIGEAFDKVSKYMGLGYPGGPLVEKLALESKSKGVFFPKLMTKGGDRRFSYSGLKTAVVTYLKKNPDAEKADIAYSFQEVALELLVRRVFQVSREQGIKNIVVAGGVAANSRLRVLLNDAKKSDESIYIPSIKLCTDNAAMVAGIGFQYFSMGSFTSLEDDVSGRL